VVVPVGCVNKRLVRILKDTKRGARTYDVKM
jgi:hypothetical protein